MTPRIPLRYCRRCGHYDSRYGCRLADLHPCERAEEILHERAKDRYLAVVTFIVVALCALLLFAGCREKPQPQPIVPKWTAMELLRMQHRNQQPTEWEMLQLAIIYTESRFNPAATGTARDAGLYQMTPVYVAEVNRVAGTTYDHADAYDPALAVEIFAAMQDYYNPAHDTDTALRYHNKSADYAARVRENLEFIRRYEAARSLIVSH